MLHPDTELRYVNDAIGFGVYATKRIPKGTITWALDELDRHVDARRVAELDELRRNYFLKYAYRNGQGQYILCWDLGRYINHSFHANCVGTAYELELAARDIEAGEQLTSDYGTLNVDEAFDCEPEEGSDRRQVQPDDLLRFSDRWDRLAADAFAHFDRVPQPLGHLIQPKFLEKVNEIVRRGVPIDSIASFYYAGRYRS